MLSEGCLCTAHNSLFDSTVRISIVPSENLVTKIVPSEDRVRSTAKVSWRGGSTTFKSHKRMVDSKSDAVARSDLLGEKWTTEQPYGLRWKSWIRFRVRTSQISQDWPP